MIAPCDLVLKECLPCNDDPIRNITAEAPDVNVFIGFRDFKWNPPLGVTYFQLGCKAICFSEVSQEEANLCALRGAQECVWDGGDPPSPPMPPGPDGPTGNPPNLPPSNPMPPIPMYRNTAQSCDAVCPDGSTHTETIPAGTITELSQSLADDKAHSLACLLAERNLFCILGETPPSACVGDTYFYQLSTNNGEDLIWSIDGDLPPGLDFDFFDATITGTPLFGGSYTFIVEVSDSLGRVKVKVLTICVMEIVTESTLPNAPVGLVYAEPLIQQPAVVSSEVWTLVSGSLPPGILLAENGSLTGIPTESGFFEFTIKVDAICNGLAVSCQKTFTIDDCMGAPNEIQLASWNDVSEPGCSFIMMGGDGTFSGTPSPVIQCEIIGNPFCNPKLEAYDITIKWDWTGSGFTTNLVNSTQVVFDLDFFGVDISPSFDANGTFSYTLVTSIPSGVHTLGLRIVSSGGGLVPPAIITGTITVRPLTPP